MRFSKYATSRTKIIQLSSITNENFRYIKSICLVIIIYWHLLKAQIKICFLYKLIIADLFNNKL